MSSLQPSLQRNKHQPTRSDSADNYRYKQIRSFKNRIALLERTLQELVDEMNVLDKKKHYQSVIDAEVKTFRPLKQTSEYRGVSYFPQRDKWRSRCYKGDEEHKDYHDTEVGAALAYDEKVKELHPDRLWMKNFVDKDETQEELKPQRPKDVHDLRKLIWKHLSVREAKAIHPQGISFFSRKHCDIAIQYIEKTKGVELDG